MEITMVDLENKYLTLFPCEQPDAPVVLLIMFIQNGPEVLDICQKMGCRPFHLVGITNIAWDQELSPWPHHWIIEPNDDFTGQAPEFLNWIETQAVPWIHQQLPEAGKMVLAGYSMGGLFSLYTATRTGAFAGITAVSPSVWYPDFPAYMAKTPLNSKVEAVYLSLGNKESDVKNPWLQKTMANIQEIEGTIQKQNVPVILQVNPGNHFFEPNRRIAKGLTWTLDQITGK